MRREKALRGLLKELREPTVQGVTERLAPYLDEEDVLTEGVDCLLDALQRLLADHTRDLTRADEDNAAIRDQLSLLRRNRDEAAQELRRAFVKVRNTLAVMYGRKAGDEVLGMQGSSPRAHDPRRLMLRVGAVLKRLQKPDLQLPKETRVDLPMTEEEIRDLPRTWIRSLETALTPLEEAIDRIFEAERQIEATRQSKGATMELHDTELSAIANLQESLLILGRKPAAARIIWKKQRPVGRPARRKKRKRAATTKPTASEGVPEKATAPEKEMHPEEVSSREVAKS